MFVELSEGLKFIVFLNPLVHDFLIKFFSLTSLKLALELIRLDFVDIPDFVGSFMDMVLLKASLRNWIEPMDLRDFLATSSGVVTNVDCGLLKARTVLESCNSWHLIS